MEKKEKGKAWRDNGPQPPLRIPKPPAPRRVSWWLDAPRDGFTHEAALRAAETQTVVKHPDK